MTTKKHRLTKTIGKAVLSVAKSASRAHFSASSVFVKCKTFSLPIRRIDGQVVGRISGNIRAKYAKCEPPAAVQLSLIGASR